MKPFAVILALLLCSCTMLKPDYFWTTQDLTNAHVKLQGGATLDADAMIGSTVITAYGSAGGNVIGSAGAAVAGVKIAGAAGSSGQRLLGAAAPTGAAVSNRHTNRTIATPTPAPALKTLLHR